MLMSGKRYRGGFKTEPARQGIDCGHSVSSLVTCLNIPHSLYAWIKKDAPDSSINNFASDTQAKIRRRQKEPKRATAEEIS